MIRFGQVVRCGTKRSRAGNRLTWLRLLSFRGAEEAEIVFMIAMHSAHEGSGAEGVDLIREYAWIRVEAERSDSGTEFIRRVW